MAHKGLKLAAAGALVIGITLVLLISVPDSGVAFAQVIEKMASVQTVHARMIAKERTGEVWAKGPNMLRINYDDGRYEISNGPILWDVNEKANRATKKPSYYYEYAQKLGVETFLTLMDVRYLGAGDMTGFFSEGPVERVTRDGRAFDVYRMELGEGGTKVHFEALADAKTHLLESLRLDETNEGNRQTVLEVRILAYDQPIPDDVFAFRPAEGMEVSDETAKAEGGEELAPPEPTGASLSGRVVWASSGKPVVGASLTIAAKYETQPDGRLKAAFLERVETDSDGRWRIKGVPEGRCSIYVRSWELAWPAEPIFAGNVGTLEDPAVLVDGPREYSGLDFRVHKPSDFYAHITIKVTDEDGNPVQGVGASLVGRDSGDAHSIDAAQGKQFSGPDGKFDAKDIWPTNEPVQVRLFNRDADSPYAAWAVVSEPFVVERKKSYDFDMVVPYGRREMKLRAVDPSGKPVADLRVSVLLGRGDWVTYLPREMSTDSEGEITITGLPANKELAVVLQRFLRDDAGRPRRAGMASACFSTEVPADREPKTIEVTFDERPVRIEGTIESPPMPPGGKLIRITYVACGLRSGWGADIRDGSFAIEGVSPGEVYLSYGSYVPGARAMEFRDCKGVIQTEPGQTYVVRIVQDRLELVKVTADGKAVEAPE